MTLAREQILNGGARKPQRLENVPEWGEDVYVRILSAKDGLGLPTDVPAIEVAVRLLLDCLVDQDGERILTEDDAEKLAQTDFPVLMRAFSFVSKLNGFPTAKLEEAMKSFDLAPNEFSSSE